MKEREILKRSVELLTAINAIAIGPFSPDKQALDILEKVFEVLQKTYVDTVREIAESTNE